MPIEDYKFSIRAIFDTENKPNERDIVRFYLPRAAIN